MNKRLQRWCVLAMVPVALSVALSACQRTDEDSGGVTSGASDSGTSQSGEESSAGGGVGDGDSAGGGMGNNGAAGGNPPPDQPRSPPAGD